MLENMSISKGGWCIVQENYKVSFLSFQTVVQPGKDSNHYPSSHPHPLTAEVLDAALA